MRVLVVDDSPFFREVLTAVLQAQPGIEIVGEAGNGADAVRAVSRLKPDVVTMDVIMPLLGGLDAVRQIMTVCPTPIVVLTASSDDKRVAVDAVGAGAFELFAKPTEGFTESQASKLVTLLREAAGSPRPRPRARTSPTLPPKVLAKAGCIGIVASTGGPRLLRDVLGGLPRNFPTPIAVVQHTIRGYAPALAGWLDDACKVDVQIARAGERLLPSMVALAPDDRHLTIGTDGVMTLRPGRTRDSHMPSGTVLLESIAQTYGRGALGIVMSGMGRDGAAGLKAIQAAGGSVVVQNPDDAEIASMPRAAVTATAHPVLIAGHNLASFLLARCGGALQ